MPEYTIKWQPIPGTGYAKTGTMTPEQAQALHEQRQRDDADHDVISCWCCCWSCDFELQPDGTVTVGPDAREQS